MSLTRPFPTLSSSIPAAVVSQTVGPYAPMLPQVMSLKLGLAPSGDSGPRGWGSRIEQAEIELGYNHIGLEELVAREGVDWARALTLIEELCACCSQANTLAYAQAVEAMGSLIVPPRAAYLRLVLAETERITSHLMNSADMMQALGLRDEEAALRDLRERVTHTMAEWSGGRVYPSLVAYGGLARNTDEIACRSLTLGLRHVERALRAQVNAIINSREVAARLVGLGPITAEEATIAGLRGPVARASGIAADMRAAFPTGAYEDEGVTIVAQRGGDAFSRLVVRLLECLESFRIVEQALDDLPPGPVKARGSAELRGGSGIGRVEGPRGEVFCWIQGGPDGLRGLHLSAGSFPTLGILPGLLRGQNLEDVRLLLLSVDLCLACAER